MSDLFLTDMAVVAFLGFALGDLASHLLSLQTD